MRVDGEEGRTADRAPQPKIKPSWRGILLVPTVSPLPHGMCVAGIAKSRTPATTPTLGGEDPSVASHLSANNRDHSIPLRLQCLEFQHFNSHRLVSSTDKNPQKWDIVLLGEIF